MSKSNVFISRMAAALALALPLAAAHAQLSPPEPGSKPPADRDLAGGKKIESSGLIEKKNANAAAQSASGSKATPHGGSANMPSGINKRSNPIQGDKTMSH